MTITDFDPSLNARKVASGTMTAIASTDVTQHCRAINALSTKLKHATRKVEEYQTAIGQHIAAIKEARPDDWEDIVKAECKLGRSRAYELLAIADGRKTVEQTRAEKAESIRRLRARPLRSGRKATTALVKVEQANDSPFQGEEWDSGPPGAADEHPADARLEDGIEPAAIGEVAYKIVRRTNSARGASRCSCRKSKNKEPPRPARFSTATLPASTGATLLWPVWMAPIPTAALVGNAAPFFAESRLSCIAQTYGTRRRLARSTS